MSSVLFSCSTQFLEAMDSNVSEETQSETTAISNETNSGTEDDPKNLSAEPAEGNVGNSDDDDSKINESIDWDDVIDDISLKDREISLSDEEKMRLRAEAENIKERGNEQFRSGEFRESAVSYTLALRTCPISYPLNRSKLYSNRAAAKMKLGLSKSAIEDCSEALELDPTFVRALWRRAQLYESADKLDEALEDCKKILENDPSHREANIAIRRLPGLITERNEKLKTEMMSKLKDLGNLFLRPFGLSTDNFQVNQDSASGGYSINFKQSY
ncbi:Tetratricopeptide repeat protein 1 [Frankliniella fusca]|uniref:Tetratricopeptide repeat protein 1 n=1 Tax=Frankliniella fusca TaxID=407009 RepID=A0AAE1LAS9_9NEOP|nr:Tetratricopeptide repeat protein 1 [Frankliniella fusca]